MTGITSGYNSPLSSSYMKSSYAGLSSGKKINSAADGASELAISQKMERQIRGLDQGSQNIQSGQNAINVADGGMSGISDMLQRMRELGLKASNGLNSPDDIKAIESEIGQLKQGITDTVGSTTYNGRQLLDGSTGSINITASANGGQGISISAGNSTLKSLGLENFGVNGNFDVKAIDNAMKQVNSSRAQMGSSYNRLMSAYNNNTTSSLNTLSSQSNIESLDYPKAISDMQKKQLMQNYAMYSQRMIMQNKQQNMNRMFGMM